ncbi:Hypothetical protein DEACI_4137 [Acididesulfobacillus acetoxydans]|uniref:Holin-like toxin n=1 Tax=Acididesulfobacillus acetoxydans TaxID=1561005 RepID=A0A8S0WRH9_9FIRM|nr:Hypothetical protein DEACI_4137 [Acididesulfobacillus acetoxydans]CEJ09660.1 Hypothetical protein DEACI_4145 [Acididesulfobacillus acetoxydans]
MSVYQVLTLAISFAALVLSILKFAKDFREKQK